MSTLTQTRTPGAAGGAEPPSAGQVAARRWRSWRAVLAFAVLLVLVSLVLAALRPKTEADYLDPSSANRDGTRALAQLIGQRGTPVHIVRHAADAMQTASAGTGTLLVVVRPERLTRADLELLSGAPADRLLIEPDQPTLTRLAPTVDAALRSLTDVSDPGPGCTLPGATAAGPVGFGGGGAQSFDLTRAHGAAGCYLEDKHPRLVQVTDAGKTTTVLGSGSPFTNQRLAEHGNAALGLNLTAGHQQVVWLMPDLPTPGSAAGEQSFWDLVPGGVKLAVLQLAIGVLLLALWRMRRFGPIVAEGLPVAVRSAETVEGRSRLYRARHARDRAAQALRAATRERLVPRLGLPRSAAGDPEFSREIVAAVAARTGPFTGPGLAVPQGGPAGAGESARTEALVGWALYGPAPSDDAELVRLSDFLDDLEKRVLGS